MSQTMNAVEITQPGGPEVLRLTTRPMPAPRAGEVVIKVAYAGVNRPDALQRAGMYAPPATASDLPGLEAAGEVHAVGGASATGRSAIRSAPCCPAVVMPNTSPRPPRIACRCQRAWACAKLPVCRKPFSPFGPTCFNAVACKA